MLETIGRAGNERVGEQRRTGLRPADGVEPVEYLLDHLLRRQQLIDRSAGRVEHRAFVVPVVRRVAAGGGGVVGRTLIDFRNVPSVADAESMTSVAARIEIRREARARRAV